MVYGRHVGWFDGPLHERVATLVIALFFSCLTIYFFTNGTIRQNKQEAATR